jgi:hypothetical protein
VNKAEALAVADERLSSLRGLTWDALRAKYLDSPGSETLLGVSGAPYELQILAFWDNKREGNIRVQVMVDDGGWRAFTPLVREFIVARDGSSVGE